MKATLPGILVPNGFTTPFYYYDQFLNDNKLDDAIAEMLNDQKFVHDPAYRRERLAGMRERIQEGRFDPELRLRVLQRALGHLNLGFGQLPALSNSPPNAPDLQSVLLEAADRLRDNFPYFHPLSADA